MHPDAFSVRYQPTSPLSRRMSSEDGSVPSSSGHARVNPPKQSARGFHLELPAYPGISSRQIRSPPSAIQSPAIALHRGTQPTPMESPRLMREKQKELIARAQLSSKLAASPMAAKPDAPRLDPLGSPKGPVTPLNLGGDKEEVDYFSALGTGRFSPARSPGARSSRSSGSCGKEDKLPKKIHKVELYQ